MTPADFLDIGALGIVAYFVWWLTQKLNGKVDRLANALDKLADAVEQLPLPDQETSHQPARRRRA